MRKSFIIFCIALFCTISCSQKEKRVPVQIDETIFAVWKRNNVEYTYTSKHQEEMIKRFPPTLEKDYYLIFFPDHRGVNMWETEIDTFIWEFSENKKSNYINFIGPKRSDLTMVDVSKNKITSN